MTKITRTDGTVISSYAPGDGNLSFAASFDGQATDCSSITEHEARQCCPYGWVLFRDGPYWRARAAL